MSLPLLCQQIWRHNSLGSSVCEEGDKVKFWLFSAVLSGSHSLYLCGLRRLWTKHTFCHACVPSMAEHSSDLLLCKLLLWTCRSGKKTILKIGPKSKDFCVNFSYLIQNWGSLQTVPHSTWTPVPVLHQLQIQAKPYPRATPCITSIQTM